MLEPETLDRRLEERARVLGDLLALHRDPCASERTGMMQTHACELVSALMEQSCGVDTRIFTQEPRGREPTGEKATTRRVAVLLYLYIAALEGLEEAGHPFAEMRWLRYMQKVRANAQVHARLFAHALARETERTVTAGARAMH